MKKGKLNSKSIILATLGNAYNKMRLDNFVFGFFIFIDFAFVTKILGGSAWITVLFLFFATCFLALKLKDPITSFLLMTIFSFQFYVPNKYYIVEVFMSHELLNGVGSYFLSYGLNIKNIFLLITFILILRNIVIKGFIARSYKLSQIIPVLLSAIFYFYVSLYSSLRFSPYTELSVVWLLHYMQMFFIALAILYLYVNKPNNTTLIMPTILSSIILEAIISIIQFVKQSWAGLPIESAKFTSVYYGAPDAISSIFRVAGTFGQSNQFGLIVLTMLILIIPETLKNKRPIYTVGSFLSIILIFLTQSRSAWVSLFAVSLITTIFYKNDFIKFVKSVGIRRFTITVAAILATTSLALIPRITLSLNAFSVNGGATLRSEMLREAGTAIQQNPWIGYGAGTNESVLLRLFPTGYVYWFPAPVHLAYAQLALESGIFGLITFIFPFIYILRNIINNYVRFGENKIRKYKEYIYVTLSGMTAFGVFYFFQPHEGTRDFYYLGIILGYGLISLGINKNQNNEKN